jgi:hypothetical protein
VTITGLPDKLTTAGYDVYVYALGGVAAKGGGYRILDAKTKEVLKDYVRVQGPAVPTSYIQAVPSEDPTVWSTGNYVVFSGVGSANIIVEATTADGLGYMTTTGDPRAPMNAIQLVYPPSAPPPSAFGLVAYYPFDDSLTDVAGGHNGIAHGGPLAFGAGKFGQGVDLEFAKSQYVEAGAPESDFDMGGGSVTISTWFRVDAWDVEWQCLVAKGEGKNYRVARSATRDSLQYAGGVGEPAVAAPGVKDGNIHHVVALTRGGVQTELWIDGTLYETAANPTITDNNMPLLIGANPDTSPLRYWNGLIDDIAIWSRALSPDEIASFWNNGAGKTIDELYGPFAVTPAEFTTIQVADGKITIEWTGDGTLQAAPVVAGPYTDVAGAASPYTFTPTGDAQFYRIKQ